MCLSHYQCQVHDSKQNKIILISSSNSQNKPNQCYTLLWGVEKNWELKLRWTGSSEGKIF